LAHQRLKWDDNGDFRAVDANGAAIDDSDRGLVPTYPYKGVGMEAFATRAVKKEAFVRRMLNTEFVLLMGREMRARDDERVIYKRLWDTAFANGGDLRQVIKTVKNVNSLLHHPVQIMGVLPTFFDARARICRDALNTLREHFGDRCYEPIRMATKIKEAPAQGKTVFEHAPDSTAAEDYARVATRILAELEANAGGAEAPLAANG
jgi:hypothetical protein